MNTINSLQVAAPETVATLATSGILVHVEVNVWTATKQDQEISDEVTQSKNADRNAGKFVKYLLANVPQHHALLKDRAAWYNWLQRETFPWAGSWRYLPNPRIPKFMAEFDKRYAVTQGMVKELVAVLPNVISNTAFQGEMFKPEDYPSPEQVHDKFGVHLYTQEVPAGDFRNQIAVESAEQVRSHFNKQLPNLIAGMMERQTEVLIKLLSSISNCCRTETVIDPTKGVRVKRGRIYDSTIEQALELCDTYKQFNITGDQRLEDARAALERLLQGINVETLRESDTLRETIKTGVDDILSKFGVKN
jgi:hypothetical protein